MSYFFSGQIFDICPLSMLRDL